MADPIVTSEKLMALGREVIAPLDARRAALERSRGDVALALADLKRNGYRAIRQAPQHASRGSSGGARTAVQSSQTRTQNRSNDSDSNSNLGIADRVRFWEEQDRINRELIPRVIRQSELLTGHIADHDNLHEIVARIVSQSLATERQEQARLFAEALDAAKADLARQSQSSLGQSRANLESALAAYKAQLADQLQSSLQQAVATMQAESRKTRNLLISVVAGGAAISIAAAIVAIFAG